MAPRGAALVPRLAVACALPGARVGLAGCGDEDDPGMAASRPRVPGAGGAFCVGARGRSARSTRCSRPAGRPAGDPADPRAPGRDARGPVRRRRAALPGPGASFSSSAGDTIWSFRVRAGVQVSGRIAAERRRGARQRQALADHARGPSADARPLRGGRPAARPRSLLPRAPRPGLPLRACRAAADRESSRRARSTSTSGDGAPSCARESRTGTGPFELRERELRARRSSPATWRGGERARPGAGAGSGSLPGGGRRRRAPRPARRGRRAGRRRARSRAGAEARASP